jgi:glycosyltransferase involved in cell wall biosynthesis
MRTEWSSRHDRASGLADWPRPPADRRVVLHTRVVAGAGGGPEKTIHLSCGSPSTGRYWVAAAYLHTPHSVGFELLRRRAADLNYPIYGVPDRGPLDPAVLRSLLRLCRQLGVRIWHAHDYKSNALGLALRPFHPMHLVTTVHGWVTNAFRLQLYYAVDRWCLPRYEQVICVSDDLVEQVRRCGVPDPRLTLLRNAVDSDTFRRRCLPRDSEVRRELAVPPGRMVLGAVGRLSPEKGFDRLLEAVARVRAEDIDFEVWIVGEGPARTQLAASIRALGLEDRVKLLGFRTDLVPLYEGLDVFALSSLREGMPNVLLEAMAMEVPVVSTDVPGALTLVVDGVTGLLTSAADVAGLAERIRVLLIDASLRARLAEAARRLVVDRFSFAERVAAERRIYDQVMDSGPALLKASAAR